MLEKRQSVAGSLGRAIAPLPSAGGLVVAGVVSLCSRELGRHALELTAQPAVPELDGLERQLAA